MTVIFLDEDLKLEKNKFSTKNELIIFLLGESEDIILGNEMNNIINTSSKSDFVNYKDFILKYKT